MVKELNLFGEVEETGAQKEWQDLPEFEQEEEAFYATIIMRFKTAEELEVFSKMLGQKCNSATKAIRFGHIIALNEKKKLKDITDINEVKNYTGLTHNFNWVDNDTK